MQIQFKRIYQRVGEERKWQVTVKFFFLIKIFKEFLSHPGVTCMRYSAIGVLLCAWREIVCLLFLKEGRVLSVWVDELGVLMHHFISVIKIILLIVLSSEDWGLFNFTAPNSIVCHFRPAKCSGVCSWESSLLPRNVWMVVFVWVRVGLFCSKAAYLENVTCGWLCCSRLKSNVALCKWCSELKPSHPLFRKSLRHEFGKQKLFLVVKSAV